jgi:hypothetical protein
MAVYGQAELGSHLEHNTVKVCILVFYIVTLHTIHWRSHVAYIGLVVSLNYLAAKVHLNLFG